MIIDKDNNGFVDFDELYFYFRQLFAISHPNEKDLPKENLEAEIDAVAFATATDVFQTVDVNGDHQISIEEFSFWYANDKENQIAYQEAKRRTEERKKIIAEANKPPKSSNEIKKELGRQRAYTKSVDVILYFYYNL